MSLIDFHNHFLAPAIPLPDQRRPDWAEIWRLLQDEAALVADIEAGDIAGRVVNSPAALIAGEDGAAPDLIRRLNDSLAEVVARHPGRLFGLVGVDIFSGEAAAREIKRGARELGLHGVFIDSAREGRLPDAPEARPGLARAAELDLPVFLYPVNPPALTAALAPYGRPGTLLARGTVNAAAAIALLQGGVFEALPDLQVVVTTLALGPLLVAAGIDPSLPIRRDTPAAQRRHIHVDTMGLDPVLIRAAVDLLGADHVLLGTDWPIVSQGPIRPRVEAAFAAAGLSAEERRQLGGGNALRLLSQARVAEPA